MSAVALNSSVWQGTRIIAPAIAGGLIALFGTASAFFFAGAGMFSFAIVVYRLRFSEVERKTTNNPMGDLLEGLKFIRDNSIFSFLMGMAFFNSFFGMAYITQMPVFARDILNIGAEGQGFLMSISGVASLLVTVWLGTARNVQHKSLLLLGGGTMTGLSVAGFALTSQYIGSYLLAGIFMFLIGIFTSMYMISIMNSLQMMVPNHMRGRVMGFFGMTWNIMPLGGLYAGAFAELVGTPSAIAIGGMLVTLFAIGSALMNKRVRSLS
jgi:MFS family permease